MRKLILLTIIVLFSFVAIAQIGAVSNDGNLLVKFIPDNVSPRVNVYQINSGKILEQINIDVNNFRKISFSPSNKFITIVSGGALYIYRRSNKRIVTAFYEYKGGQFAKNDQIIAVISNSSVFTYNLNSLKQIKYPILNKIPVKVGITSDGRFIVAKTQDNWLYIWRYGFTSSLTMMQASDFRISNNKLIIQINNSQSVSFKIYQFPQDISTDLQLIHTTGTDILLTKYHLPTTNIIISKCLLDTTGQKFAVYQTFGDVHYVTLFNIFTDKLIGKTNSEQHRSYSLIPMKWLDNKLILKADGLNGLEYNYNQNTTTYLYWQMLNPLNSPKLSPSEQLKKRIFSPNYRNVLMTVYQGPRRFVLIRNATINLRQISYPDAIFIAFSPDSKYLYLQIKGYVFYIKTSDLKGAMTQNTVAQIHQLGSELTIKEKFIPNDQPPAGYHYVFAKDIKPVTQVDSQKLFVLLRGLNLNPKNINIKLNLIDQNGDIITGATNPQWLYLWCRLLIMNKSLKVQQTNFIVKEVNETQPTAYALVLDHSGSMGNYRANALQFGALQLIMNKRPQDAFLLIKYDNRVDLEVNLTKNKQAFFRYLNHTGLQGFGGGTALNDATFLAIEELKKSNYPKKIVLLFTDGKENASIHTKAQVIAEAKRYGVEIFTIGFGTQINAQYLMDLAYMTGGSFYHIYRTSELKRIFLDIDIKRRHYYKFNFITKQPGQYIALLQMCQNFKHHDSIVVAFNNLPNIPVEQKHVTVNPPLLPKQKQILKQHMIPCRPPTQPVKDQKIVKEFENIDFPNIYFAFNSARIIRSEEKGIIEIANFMKKYPDVYLLIEGHTDSVGTYQYNIELSKRRAEAAKRLLVQYGIAPGRIFTKGYGYTRPLATNKTAAGRAKNRRIEFKIFRYK